MEKEHGELFVKHIQFLELKGGKSLEAESERRGLLNETIQYIHLKVIIHCSYSEYRIEINTLII